MDNAIIYIENLDKIFNGDKTLIYKACNSFIKYVDYYINLMKSAHKEGNWSEIKRIAHSFKTSLSMFGDKNVLSILSRLEHISQENEKEKKLILDEFIIAVTKVKNTSQYIMHNMRM